MKTPLWPLLVRLWGCVGVGLVCRLSGFVLLVLFLGCCCLHEKDWHVLPVVGASGSIRCVLLPCFLRWTSFFSSAEHPVFVKYPSWRAWGVGGFLSLIISTNRYTPLFFALKYPSSWREVPEFGSLFRAKYPSSDSAFTPFLTVCGKSFLRNFYKFWPIFGKPADNHSRNRAGRSAAVVKGYRK